MQRVAPGGRRRRVEVLAPYWSFFEHTVAFDLRADRRRLAAEVTELVVAGDGLEAGGPWLIDSREAGEEAARRLRADPPDAVVVIQSMCAPPAFVLAAIEAVPGVPLVVLVATRRSGVADDLSHADITAQGATVGAPQLTNVLSRTGRRHDVVLATLDGDPSDARAAVAAAAAAGSLRGARLLRVGRPIDGYDCVTVEAEALRAATGIAVVDVEPSRVRRAYLDAEGSAARAIATETRGAFDVDRDLEGDGFDRSMRFAAALAVLDDQLHVDAGAMNCHVEELRFAPDEPGITPCFALGRETSRGVPWTCAGDAVTAVAMLVLKRLGLPALYHEIEALDHERGQALLANSGEHDLALADPATRPRLLRNAWWAGDARCGACACFAPAPGPASLVAFTPHGDEPSGFRFIVAEGAFVQRALTETGTAHAAFRFACDESVGIAWTRWVRAGVNHHSAATTGHAGAAVAAVARHLGVGCVITTDRSGT
jgi:L-arabinose isomerase